ncbi:N-6 DNA methylase [bacterium]|nr:N-6 DNA methylase [bacterium]
MLNKKEDRLDDILSKCRSFLRGKLDYVENRNAVLMLVFLKFAQDKFIARQHEIIMTEGVGALDDIDLYHRANVLYLEQCATWNYIVQNSSSSEIAKLVDEALSSTEKNNPVLEGVFLKGFFSSLDIEPEKLRAFIESVDLISDVAGEDIIGRVYEFFITHYAMDERKIRGEYFTPKSIVELMVELIEPYENIVYEPCFGTGGLFVQSSKFSKKVKSGALGLFGQEINKEMWRLTKLNLALHGIQADLGQKCASVFLEDIHPTLKSDYILANPPFNQRSWRDGVDFLNDKRFSGFDFSKSPNGNYAWLLHILSKLNEGGVAGVILSNSPLNSEEEYLIRKSIVEGDKIEAIIVLPREMFYSTDISVSLWILNNNKKQGQKGGKIYRDRTEQVLFMDLRTWTQNRRDGNFVVLDEAQIEKIKEIFGSWRYESGVYSDIPELCASASLEAIRAQNYNLVPSRYIDFEHKNTDLNFEKEMSEIIEELREIKSENEKCFSLLKNAVESFGYDL